LLLGYKPVQHVTVLNTVGNCNTMVSIIILYYNINGTVFDLKVVMRRIRIHIYIYIYIYVCVCVCVRVYIDTYICH